jgi:hypothetical protein
MYGKTLASIGSSESRHGRCGDGAFIAHQTDLQATLENVLHPFAASPTAIRKTLRDPRRRASQQRG